MFFINNYKWLSNMDLFTTPITINSDGVEEVIKSSENYYQSRKTNDPILRAKILKMNPYEAKRYCKKHSGNIDLVDNWDDIKEDVMYEALKIKFTNNIHLFLKLIFLTDEIIEDNTWRDRYWGRYLGVGENRLGVLLTRLRNSFIPYDKLKDRLKIGNLYSSPMENNDLLKYIDYLGDNNKYRPLNHTIAPTIHDLYKSSLNGFDSDEPRPLSIDNELIARKYERVVIGDYGAYVEIDKKDLLVDLIIPPKQEWRIDRDYIMNRGLNVKYIWYEYKGRKVYLQTNTVTYADYKPGYYYISVLYFDLIEKKDCIKYRCFTANSHKYPNNGLCMGKGNALTTKQMYPGLDIRIGKQIRHLTKFGVIVDNMTNIISFQTKISWKNDSALDIIQNSIAKLLNHNITDTIGLPFPGINNGNLKVEDVTPLLLDLPKNISIWIDKPLGYFTGIGSRTIPDDIKEIISKFTKYMTMQGFIYRSGGADGTDKGSEAGVVDNRKEIYIPWKGFNKSDSLLFKLVDSDDTIKIASENHPAYEYLKPPVKKLMNRNVYQVLGYDLKTPSKFIICYTEDGCKSHLTRTSKTGGTGLAISVASKLGIPIINLGNKDDLELIKKLLKSIDEKDKD